MSASGQKRLFKGHEQLLHRDAGLLHHASPFGGFRFDELAVLGGCHPHGIGAFMRERLLHFRRILNRREFLVQLCDDGCRRAGGCDDADPVGEFVAGSPD
jgi:hypothetical protein